LAGVPDNHIDYVFVDPPFGDNIFYADLADFLGRCARLVEGLAGTDQASLFSERIEDPADDRRLHDSWHAKWFQEEVLRHLLTIDQAVSSEHDDRLRRIGRIALSEVLRRSSNAHPGYPNVMFQKDSPAKDSPAPHFLRTLDRICAQVSTLAKVGLVDRPRLIRGDATAIPLAPESVDGIVTHPPYIASIPYAEYGQLSLRWMGYDHKQLDAHLTGGRRQAKDVVNRFYSAYARMLQESHRVLRRGRLLFLMVGNPTVRGRLIDLTEMTMTAARQASFEFVAKASRNGINRRANKMGHEDLLFFAKK